MGVGGENVLKLIIEWVHTSVNILKKPLAYTLFFL